MMNYFVIAVVVLGLIALVSAVILYVVSKKFSVKENTRVLKVQALLPGANCGGCGFAGCSGMADALVNGAEAGSIDGLQCPVGGVEVMSQIADLLGMSFVQSDPMVAVVRCDGTCEFRPQVALYDGLHTCAAMNAASMGESGCGYGCLGCGDCIEACLFDAIHLNPDTGLPEVEENKCTACGACVKKCPRNIIELRKIGPEGHRIYVCCMNRDKGIVARKACNVACIGCGKCEKVCEPKAITVTHNLAYINDDRCIMCTKCVDECPTGAIMKVNFLIDKKEAEV